jgi:hypothetical protein
MGATYNALETYKDTFNAGFQRDEAAIHTIVLSDEADLTQASTVTEPEFITGTTVSRKRADERTFSSIVRHADRRDLHPHQRRDRRHHLGHHRGETTRSFLDRLGVQAAGLKRELLPLAGSSVLGTIEVSVVDSAGTTFYFEEAVEVEDPVTYISELVGRLDLRPSRNSITFLEYIPEVLSKVTIHTYEIESTRQDAPEPEPTDGHRRHERHRHGSHP